MSLKAIENRFTKQGWKPFPFQKQSWKAFRDGQDVLIHSQTGSGKTLAAALGPLTQRSSSETRVGAIRILWINPLRALTLDLERALQTVFSELAPAWRVESRTGDTSGSKKSKQIQSLPEVLITTPESLSLLLTHEPVQKQLVDLELVVVDEWHELIGSKRGVQTELALARLKRLNPKLRINGLSATLGDPTLALRCLVGMDRPGALIRGSSDRRLQMECIIPDPIEKFPHMGRLGMRVVEQVLEVVDTSDSALVFTNTRNQAENWYQKIQELRPDWEIGLHHGSIELEERRRVEMGIRSGELRCVVCTASLDLGVDFPPVDLVVQVGSPKGIGRLLQRAGRSGHSPGKPSRILCTPTHTFELIEFSAARRLIERGEVEPRTPLELSLDALSQHLVTLGMGGGFAEQEAWEEARSTYCFRDMTESQWKWLLDFVSFGGHALREYQQFARLKPSGKVGSRKFQSQSKEVERFHRMNIGTITSDNMVQVQFLRGGKLGFVEEAFISRLRPGESFLFAGRKLKLVQFRDMKAFVRTSSAKQVAVPRWVGGRMPLSTHLASETRREIERYALGQKTGPETAAAAPLLEAQKLGSALPLFHQLLVEVLSLRDGWRMTLYPFEGRAVHEGLGALLAFRLSQTIPVTVSITVNDYGLELLASEPIDVDALDWRDWFRTGPDLDQEILEAAHGAEMAKRQFREIARVAGLVFQGFPGAQKSVRQIQASSGLLFDVFQKYDPHNLLLEQARQEALKQQFDRPRLLQALENLRSREILISRPKHLTPMAFPLWMERMSSQISSESFEDRVEKMIQSLNKKAP